MGFVQVWLEVVAISINNIAALVRARPTSPNIDSKYLSCPKVVEKAVKNKSVVNIIFFIIELLGCQKKWHTTTGLCAGVALEFRPPETAARLCTKDK